MLKDIFINYICNNLDFIVIFNPFRLHDLIKNLTVFSLQEKNHQDQWVASIKHIKYLS